MTFKGWKAEALEFFDGLEADNSKVYWQAHKAFYDAEVLAPMKALVAELEPAWGTGKIFRPYRDVRFSADKTPYKTTIAAMVGRGYVQLDANGLAAGVGMWEIPPAQIEAYRQAVVGDRSGRKLAAIVAKTRAAGYGLMSRETLKSTPRGYPKNHARIELLRMKGVAAWGEWPAGAWLGTAKAKDRVTEFFKAAKPLSDWLETNVGD